VSYIRHRGNPGSWTFQVETGEKPRRRIFKSGFRTKREAEAALHEVIVSLKSGSYVPPKDMTVGEFAETWLPRIENTVKPSTLCSYRGHVVNYVVPHLGRLPLQKLSSEGLSSLYADLVKDGLSHVTVRHVHVTVHRMLRDAVKGHHVPVNVADGITLPKTSSKPGHEMQVWTQEELRSFLDSTQDTREHALWVTLGMTGLRRAEVCGLRWQDADLTRGKLTVRQTIVSVGYQLRTGTPKSGKSRVVPIGSGTIEALKAQAAQQADDAQAWGSAWTDSGLVFTKEDGTGLHPDRVSKLFEQAVQASKLPRIRLHDLRHSHASHLLLNGTHPKVVQGRLGHSSIMVTMDIYSHLMPDMQEDAAVANEELVFASVGGNA
jgi:integrase